jgi:hypothetical protein
MIEFSSLNPYETLQAITGDSPEDLIAKLREIRTPIKIVAIVPNGTRHVAYVMGDVRIQTKKKPKGV